MEEKQKKIIFSGIQPSGSITLGNYLGALKNWVDLQNDPESEYECRYCVVDMHAITVRQDPDSLRRRTMETYALLMACGIDATKTLTFVQSHVPSHAELSWVLNCFTGFGELSRMTQFKDKSQKNTDNINAGLFTYPVLMAADILLYNTDCVPVGIDQKQHLELARDVAMRFNAIHPNTFKVPDPYIGKVGAKIYSLAEPTQKMSKSDSNANAYVAILDSKDQIIKKFKKAVTDSEARVYFGDGKDGINNLMSIYSIFTGKNNAEIESEFEGQGYGAFKVAVGETVADSLAFIRNNYEKYMADQDFLKKMMAENAQKARQAAEPIMTDVYKKVGFLSVK